MLIRVSKSVNTGYALTNIYLKLKLGSLRKNINFHAVSNSKLCDHKVTGQNFSVSSACIIK